MITQGYIRLCIFTAVLAFLVVVVGAYTRLSDAGLGCPDWPGCYGQLVVPGSDGEVASAEARYPERALESHKAWKEMVHRYLAGTLGLLILGIAVWSWRLRGREGAPLALPLFLLALVIFQALLGMWTVTLLLKPVVVMGHLLGGMATLSLLVWLSLRVGDRNPPRPPAGLKAPAFIGLLILVAQIALGGWTSSNYAALACPDFPQCQGQWWPPTDFGEAFILWRGLGVNYEFGVLDNDARVTIHLMHRIGALVTFVYLAWLAVRLVRSGVGAARLRANGVLLAVLLCVQVLLGVGNVVLHLPLGVAVAHNGVAALLLLSLVWLNHQLWPPR